MKENCEDINALKAEIQSLRIQLEKKQIEADALRETGTAIGSMLNLGDMLNKISDIVTKTLDTDLCMIYLFDLQGNELVLSGASELGRSEIGHLRFKAGEGITGWVAKQGEPVVLNNSPWMDERFVAVPSLGSADYNSMLSVPLRGGSEIVGVINVSTNPPHEYTHSQIELLDSIARQIGGAVENYYKYRRMEQTASQITTLSEISKTITSDLYLEEILQLIVGMTAESMNFKICSIMLLDESKQELVIKATQSKSVAYLRKPNVKLADSVAGRAIIENKPITILDVRKTPGYRYPDLAKEEGLCSLIALPLRVKKEVIGVLNCYTENPHIFTEEEINILTALANQAAMSIHNAKLMVRTAVVQEMHHRVKNSLQTIASLLRLQLKIGKLSSPDEALKQSINRIQSIATVHELLSNENLDDVSSKKLSESILSANAYGLLPDGNEVITKIIGDDIQLHSSQATYVSLILNELIQNAVEHGINNSKGNLIVVEFSQDDINIILEVKNNGVPLSENFNIKDNSKLGLKIVESLVRDNLFGNFELKTVENNITVAKVTFPK
ncbi:MAG: GAF domain-containing protein [Armatimonadota bacterium]